MTEQARGARDRKQSEALAKALGPGEEEVEDHGEEVVLLPARADIALAPTVVREQPIRWGAPVMNRNVPSVERPWQG